MTSTTSQPQIAVYVTSIFSNPKLRSQHERVHRHLTSARLVYTTHDVASDEAAKAIWKRKNRGNNELPCILVDGEPVGSVDALDEAVEFNELPLFLRLTPPPSNSTGPILAPPSSSNAPSPLPTDEFSLLSLSPTELASLSASLLANPNLNLETEPSPSSASFSSTTYTPLELPASVRERRKAALPEVGGRKLAERAREDLLDGVQLTEEEVKELLEGFEKKDIVVDQYKVEEEVAVAEGAMPVQGQGQSQHVETGKVEKEHVSTEKEVKEAKEKLNLRDGEGKDTSEVPSLGLE